MCRFALAILRFFSICDLSVLNSLKWMRNYLFSLKKTSWSFCFWISRDKCWFNSHFSAESSTAAVLGPSRNRYHCLSALYPYRLLHTLISLPPSHLETSLPQISPPSFTVISSQFPGSQHSPYQMRPVGPTDSRQFNLLMERWDQIRCFLLVWEIKAFICM